MGILGFDAFGSTQSTSGGGSGVVVVEVVVVDVVEASEGAYSCFTCFGALLAGTLSNVSTLLANIILVGRTVVRRNDSKKPLRSYLRLFSALFSVDNKNGRTVVVREFLPILPPAVVFLGTFGVLREPPPPPPSENGGDETLWNFCWNCCCCLRLALAAFEAAPGFWTTIIGY